MDPCKFSVSTLLALVSLSLSVAAQSPSIPEQGTKPDGNYRDGDIDVISLVNKKLDLYPSDASTTLTIEDSSTQAAEAQAKPQTGQSNNPKEIELEDVIFNETGGLRADPKAKPGTPGSAENLHGARVAVGEIAERVLKSPHPEREQAPRTLTHETVRDLNAGNKDVAKALDEALNAVRSRANMTNDAMHFRTGRHKFKSLYGRKGTMYFGPFHDVTGGKRYLTIAP
jgi:hypothetical protein